MAEKYRVKESLKKWGARNSKERKTRIRKKELGEKDPLLEGKSCIIGR